MRNKKVISWILLLACIFTFNISNVIAYAEVNSKREVSDEKGIEDFKKTENEEKIEPKIIKELVDKRTANTKQFLKEEMTIEAVTYDEAVHYKDGDYWKEVSDSRYMRLYDRERSQADYGISLYEFQVYDDNSIGATYEYHKDDRPLALYSTGGLKVNGALIASGFGATATVMTPGRILVGRAITNGATAIADGINQKKSWHKIAMSGLTSAGLTYAIGNSSKWLSRIKNKKFSRVANYGKNDW